MEPATWRNCGAEFGWYDGAFVDLIAFGTGLPEWESFVAALRAGPFRIACYRDGEPTHMVETAAAALAEREAANMLMSVQVDAITATCHLFGGDLELDIDPRDIASEAAFESVLGLMRFVSAAITQPVFASPENAGRKGAFLCVTPEGKATYLSSSVSLTCPGSRRDVRRHSCLIRSARHGQ